MTTGHGAIPRRALTARTRRRRDESSYVANDTAVFELTEVAAVIWRLCDGSNTVADISDRIVDEYEVEPEVARRDTMAFLGQLEGAELITWS